MRAWGGGAILAVAWSWTIAAQAVEVRYEMESAAEFEADGWFQNSSGSAPSFSDGQMTVASDGYNEWILYNDPDSPTRWWNYVNAGKGWWIEARLQILQGPSEQTCFDGGPGIWMHDGTNLIKFTFTSSSARISYPMLSSITMDPTDAFHTYRVQNLGGSNVQVLVDGELQLDVELTAAGGGTEGITIGDLGGCGASAAVWEYLAYDTAAPGTETEDADGDGIETAVDLCPEVADVEQLDTDADRLGDACDACPNDPQNDSDADGLCADEDICPQSTDNTDSDGNGICDANECIGGGLPGGLPVAIAAPCLPGASPNCCPFYGVDPVLPPPTGGVSGSGGGAAGGTAGMGTGGTNAGGTGVGGSQAAGAGTGDPLGAAGSANSGVSHQAANTNSSGTCSFTSPQTAASSSWAFGMMLVGCVGMARRRNRSRRRTLRYTSN